MDPLFLHLYVLFTNLTCDDGEEIFNYTLKQFAKCHKTDLLTSSLCSSAYSSKSFTILIFSSIRTTDAYDFALCVEVTFLVIFVIVLNLRFLVL